MKRVLEMEIRMQIVRRVSVLGRGVRAFAWVLAAWLASCGGGSQIQPFQPRQIILLGDETVVLVAGGKRYGINGVDANNNIDCSQLPVWSQQLVGNFGIVLDLCNPSAATAVHGVTRGAANAKVADLDAQIAAQLAAGDVTSKDLFVVMVGLNDIIERYEAGAGCGDAELGARGHLVAAQVNRLVAAGGRVILSTVHDLGLTPYAGAKNALAAGQSALLTCLTDTFNARLRVDIVQDGRFIGLVLADDTTKAMVRNPGAFGLGNVTDAPCTVALPDCTTATLAAGATTATHLWADDRHFGPAMNNQLALAAETRARNNPF